MASHPGIVLVSSACRFPDADSPAALFANVMEGRRSFRAVPPERLDIARYAPDAVGEAESITPIRAGLLTDWTFDRTAFRIPKKTFEATDLAHWLALELAAGAARDIGGTERIDRDRTAVVVANTLTGEFSRAALLRFRLPFLDEILARSGAADALRADFAAELRKHFPEPNEDSLAGGLANTIAGRIANHFDFRAGAYSVDGACASSLVALADAANLLMSEQADAVFVVGVDLSIDPFELVGFSRNGALAAGEMRVFDARANGFWPGEGGACVLLMREDEARRRDLPTLARIAGWGLSTDGAGGLTRPSSAGQLLACRRAYEMAGVDPADVAFIEAHGTGTAIGDPTEVRALGELRADASAPLAIGSIKANIGHTKAAAGLAGFIKIVEALRHGLIPPHVGCTTPHPVFAEIDHRVRPALRHEPIEGTAVAGVSGFGFGGINSHVVIEGMQRRPAATALPQAPVAQDGELFVFSAESAEELAGVLAAYARRAPSLSMSELTDAAAHAAGAAGRGGVRAAVVASDGPALAERLARATEAVTAQLPLRDRQRGVFVDAPRGVPRIGLLFPGQGAAYRIDGGAWARRFPPAADFASQLPSAAGREMRDTALAQPAIVAASLAASRILERFGVSASIAIGHSVGEIAALAWAGALDATAALELARIRGAIMAEDAAGGGAMLRVALTARDAEEIGRETASVVACRNGARECVLAGSAAAIEHAAARCREAGVAASRLAVSHAFHSPHMEPAAERFADAVRALRFAPLAKPLASTITGARLPAEADAGALLLRQITHPVLFDAALQDAAADADVFVEAGPGQALTRLAGARGLEAYAVDAFSDSLGPLLASLGALFVAGAEIDLAGLFADRNLRPFEVTAIPSFLKNPCGSDAVQAAGPVPAPQEAPIEWLVPTDSHAADPLAVTLSAVAHETGLSPSQIGVDDRFLDTLHLNSLAVTRIVAAAAKALDARAPSAPTEFADATPRELAAALEELKTFGDGCGVEAQRVPGVQPWVRTYAMTWAEARARPRSGAAIRWADITIGDGAQPTDTEASAGLLIRLDDDLTMADAMRLFARVAEAATGSVQHLALCHCGAPVSAFARSVARERHFRSVRVIDRVGATPADARIQAALAADITGYYEVRLGGDGAIAEPVFAPQTPSRSPTAAIGPDDVVVIVGGAKGIAAECALEIGRGGAAIVLVGRSGEDDSAVAATLSRADRGGMRCRYVRADVLNLHQLRASLAPALAEFGRATTLVFAAGANEPGRLTQLDAETVQHTLALKTAGLETVLQALGAGLRRLITFGSLIGRIGLEGETHYALANAMQTAATDAWAKAAPNRTALALEWSVWGGTGMGERLGTIERLSAEGVDAVGVDDALEAFGEAIDGGLTGTIAVTSRFGPPPDLSLGDTGLPLLRFVDKPKVHFPGVELIVETEISRGRDAYVDDHVLDGFAVLPAVIGLEAMAQTASATGPIPSRIALSEVVFTRPVTVPAAGTARIRIAALRETDGRTAVHLSAEDDDFAAPCIRAILAPGRGRPADLDGAQPCGAAIAAAPLYGPLFFHGDRFRRLETIDIATSRHVGGQLRGDAGTRWFGGYEPAALILWDPGATDAALHAMQAACPHRRLVPICAERIEIDRDVVSLCRFRALERMTDRDTYTFDLVLTDSGGRVGQRWTNVRFRAVGTIPIAPVLTAAPGLAAAYLERVVREAIGDDGIRIALISSDAGSRAQRRDIAIDAFGLNGRVDRRSDGRPLRMDGKGTISFAHAGAVTLAVTAGLPIGCDIEAATANNGEAQPILRHTLIEACRKLGRKLAPESIPPIGAGAPFAVGDMTAVALELPLASGRHIVTFACRERAPRVSVPRAHTAQDEVSL